MIGDPRTGRNGRHRLAGLLRQSIFSRLAGYEDVNDADRLRRHPVIRQLVGGRAVKRGAASASAMGRFETAMVTRPENLVALADLPGRWIDAAHDRRPPKVVTLDTDSSESPVPNDQDGAMWSCTLRLKSLHPLFVFNQFGDLERCALRPGNVHNADGCEDVLKPVLARYSKTARPSITRRRFRTDAAFAIPALFDLLEAEGCDYAVRIKGNPKLHERISWLAKRRPGRPPHHVVRRDTSLHYRARSWSKARLVVAKIEFHPGELFPRVGYIVTNRSLPNERVLAFYSGRGTAEQHVTAGKYALKWTRFVPMGTISVARLEARIGVRWSPYRLPSGCDGRSRRLGEAEVGLVAPHAVQNDAEVPRHRDAGAGQAAAAGDVHAPGAQARPFLAAHEQGVGGLVESSPGQLIAAATDPPLNLSLARSMPK